MAKKKKKKLLRSSPLSIEDVIGFQEDIFKEWSGKVCHGSDIRDGDLQSISTGSVKLDWALGIPLVEGSANEIYGENSTGKAQPLDATVMTPGGPKTMGSLSLGDEVCTPNGKSAKIVGVFPQGEIDIYKVSFTDGSSTECCKEHLWYTETLLDRNKKRKGSVKNTEEISNSLKRKDGANNHMIPMSRPVKFDYTSNDCPVHPYLLGLLLGDGYIPEKYSLMFSSADDELVNLCNNLLSEYGCKLNYSAKYDYRIISDKTNTKASVMFKQRLLSLGLLGKKSATKFIPSKYLTGTIPNRMALLRGLMDTDGTIGTKGDITFTSTSEELSNGVKYLVQSLGGRATIKSRITQYEYKGEKKDGMRSFRVNITMHKDINPFVLSRKSDRFNELTTAKPIRLIENIEYVGKKKAKCIKIDSEDELYLTDEFIVTHNTTFALEIAANAIRMGKPVFYFDLERKLRESQLNMINGLGDAARKLFTRIRPDTGEEAVNMIERCVKEVPGCLVVFDSITAMLPEVEGAEDAAKQSMGLVARLCWKMVRKVLGPAERNLCTLLFISHITTNLNPYASGDTVKGGKAIGDMSSQRIRLKRLNSHLIKDAQGNIIGQMTICRVIKNNMARPFREVSVPIIYGKGIDKSLDLLQLAKDLCIIEYSNGWYRLVNDEFPEGKNHREADMLSLIRTNKEYRDGIIRQTKELLED